MCDRCAVNVNPVADRIVLFANALESGDSSYKKHRQEITTGARIITSAGMCEMFLVIGSKIGEL